LKLVADTGAEQDINKTSNKRAAYLVTGVIYSPHKNLDLDAGLKFGIGCRACENNVDRQLGIGLTRRF
jgi:hypothetical protein